MSIFNKTEQWTQKDSFAQWMEGSVSQCGHITAVTSVFFYLTDVKDNRGGRAKHNFLIDALIVTLLTCPHANPQVISSLCSRTGLLQSPSSRRSSLSICCFSFLHVSPLPYCVCVMAHTFLMSLCVLWFGSCLLLRYCRRFSRQNLPSRTWM